MKIISEREMPTPEGCRWCGVAYRDHPQLWVKSKGWHGWEAPTKAQIRARIGVKYPNYQGENSDGPAS